MGWGGKGANSKREVSDLFTTGSQMTTLLIDLGRGY